MKPTLFVLLIIISMYLAGESIDRLEYRIEVRRGQLQGILQTISPSDDQYLPALIREYIHTGIDGDSYTREIREESNNKMALSLQYLNEIYLNIEKIREIKIEQGFKKLYGDSGIDETLMEYLSGKGVVDSQLLDLYYSQYLENGGNSNKPLSHLKYLGYKESEYDPSLNYSLKIKHNEKTTRLRIKTHLVFNSLNLNNIHKKSDDLKEWGELLINEDLWDVIPMLLTDKNVMNIIDSLNLHIKDKSISPIESFNRREFILLRDRIRVISHWTKTDEFYFLKEVINE